MTVTFYGRAWPTASDPDFTLVALPDTQKYSKYYPDIFNNQTQWIVDNRSAQNIAFVTHLGDIVDDYDTPYQWRAADAAISKLEPPGIPYGLTPGNCDENGYGGSPTGWTLFDTYFPASRYQGRAYYGGNFNGDNRNSYQLFSASGLDFVILHLQFYNPNPEPAIVTWANNVLQNYGNRAGIVTSHYLLDT